MNLFGNAYKAFLEVLRLRGIELDYKPSSAFERHTHDQAASLFGYFHRAVASTWFHSRH